MLSCVEGCLGGNTNNSNESILLQNNTPTTISEAMYDSINKQKQESTHIDINIDLKFKSQVSDRYKSRNGLKRRIDQSLFKRH
jgi:hypothetical protein